MKKEVDPALSSLTIPPREGDGEQLDAGLWGEFQNEAMPGVHAGFLAQEMALEVRCLEYS